MKKMKFPRFTLHRLNNILFVLIVLINVYIILAPIVPQITYWWDGHHTQRRQQLEKLIQVQ